MPTSSARRSALAKPMLLAVPIVVGLLLLNKSLQHRPPSPPVPHAVPVTGGQMSQAQRRQSQVLESYLAICKRKHKTPDPVVLKNLHDPERAALYILPPY